MSDNKEFLELILNEIKNVQTQLGSMEEKISSIETRMDSIENRMNLLQSQVYSVHVEMLNRFDKQDKQLELLANELAKSQKV